jgi:hypothetical protein
MSAEGPTTNLPLAQETTVDEPPGHEPDGDDGVWIEEREELPRRPRRRLLTPATGALLAALLAAGGFLGGVLVEKGQGSSASSAGATGAGAGARFRGGAAGAGAGGGAGAGTGAGGRFAGAGAGAGGATVGQVAFIQGSTLYVTDTQGNTVKVTTSAGSAVTKSVKASVGSIHPGETVVVTGSSGAGGAVNAESIRVAGAGEGGAAASLLGGSGGKARSAEPSLFGNGG